MTKFFNTTRHTLAILIGISIPTSVVLTNILCPLALLFILVEGRYKQKFNTLRQHPLIILALLLFAVMLFSFFYTSVSFSEAWLMVDKYREFLYISLFILLFQDNITRKWGLYAFLGAMGITLFLSYLVAITGYPIAKGIPENPAIFKNYITQSVLMVLAAYFVMVLGWEKKGKWLYGIIVLLAIYNVIFMSEGRTGYLLLLCLIFLFVYQNYHFRGVMVSSILVAILSVLVYQYSGILQKRIDKMTDNIEVYQQGDTNTSVGKRLEFYKNSLILIAQNPLLGTGSGSFAFEYKRLAESKGISSSTNPHNEYLMIAVQWGLLGAGLFIALLYQMWRMTSHLKIQKQWMAQGLVITIVVGCLVNSLWLDNTEGHIFAYLIGVFYGGMTFKSSINVRNEDSIKYES
ncbi:O-antigen ligase family protein [Candidatus Parabeggiatoa sp. HSG14]|uniref:O-antigen ligase family protein n=1 Tax=Candidatus Parabeggiatoa sp. HSG14 TaxID=3055593 RepID=UPI0025A7CF29|nr:O-antigen ligase family protein [Thiotrichales bacterium HSG14]